MPKILKFLKFLINKMSTRLDKKTREALEDS